MNPYSNASDDPYAVLRWYANGMRGWINPEARPESPRADQPPDTDDARAQALDAEAVRERDWSDLEATAREFIQAYGVAALLRCISRAVDDQKELPL